MKILPLSFDSAAKNLAFEEWYFQHFQEETLRIWCNPTSVIVGKHQNAYAESNYLFCKKENIPVIRRISGGGAVFHDLGNINFSFFRFTDKEKLIDYDANLDIISAALRKLDYPVQVNKRHDIFLNKHKVSGNAQHVSKGRALHHGTILYDADMALLSRGIKRTSGSFEDKAVKSVRSPVVNLRSILNLGTSDQFVQKLLNAIAMEELTLSKPDHIRLQELMDTKYLHEDWNIGYGPAYTFTNSHGGFQAHMAVARGGEIQRFELSREQQIILEATERIQSLRHRYSEIADALPEDGFGMGSKENCLQLLF